MPSQECPCSSKDEQVPSKHEDDIGFESLQGRYALFSAAGDRVFNLLHFERSCAETGDYAAK